MSARVFDPINKVWMRVIPNVGLSFAEYDAEQDAVAIEHIMRLPEAQELITKLALQSMKAD